VAGARCRMPGCRRAARWRRGAGAWARVPCVWANCSSQIRQSTEPSTVVTSHRHLRLDTGKSRFFCKACCIIRAWPAPRHLRGSPSPQYKLSPGLIQRRFKRQSLPECIKTAIGRVEHEAQRCKPGSACSTDFGRSQRCLVDVVECTHERK